MCLQTRVANLEQEGTQNHSCILYTHDTATLATPAGLQAACVCKGDSCPALHLVQDVAFKAVCCFDDSVAINVIVKCFVQLKRLVLQRWLIV